MSIGLEPYDKRKTQTRVACACVRRLSRVACNARDGHLKISKSNNNLRFYLIFYYLTFSHQSRVYLGTCLYLLL